MKRWIARAMILCMGILLMGCQKTPVQAVVIGKENDGWEDAAAAEDETTQLGAGAISGGISVERPDRAD